MSAQFSDRPANAHECPFTTDSVLTYFLLIFTVSSHLCSAIDPQELIGTCKPINLNATYYVNANEGVWFPQYRAEESKRHTRGNTYSCHTTYEKVYLDEGEHARLDSDTYYTLNGKVIKEGYSCSYHRSEQRGKLVSSINIPNYGNYHVFNYILKLTPEYRVRYVCTDFPSTRIYAVYIETRKTFPDISTIREAKKALQQHNLRKPMVKINQKNCTRPINMDGYVSLLSDEKSK